MTAADYQEKVAAGGCCNLLCPEQGQSGYAIWWKCPAGHREELRYCQVHGPVHLKIALRGPRIECHDCGGWMSPMIEGLPAGGPW